MKIIFFTIFSFLALTGHSQETSRHIPLDSITASEAGFIALVIVDKYDGENIFCRLRLSFKGGKCSYDIFPIRVWDDRSSFNYGEEYLIFAEEDGPCKYSIDKDSRILSKENSEKDIVYLFSKLPCFDPKLKESKKNSICLRNYSPVCGCDGVTYGNECEALKKRSEYFLDRGVQKIELRKHRSIFGAMLLAQ